jgi:hypothetical protein
MNCPPESILQSTDSDNPIDNSVPTLRPSKLSMSEDKTDSTPVAESSSSDVGPNSRSRQPVGLLILWCAVVAIAGGYACGHALASFAIVGSFSFLLLGAVAGWTARIILRVSGKLGAACLAVACFVACFVALVFRIRLTNPTLSWRVSLSSLDLSLASDNVFASFAIGCAIFGGLLACFPVLRKTQLAPRATPLNAGAQD